jgi:hypothetical protein
MWEARPRGDALLPFLIKQKIAERTRLPPEIKLF